MAISVSGSQIQFNDASTQNTAATGFGFKNRIINGAMVIDQRNAGAATTLTNGSLTYNVDRWAGLVNSATSTVTMQRVSSSLAGLPYAVRVLRGSGSFTGGYWITQAIETNNCQDLAGQTITISLYIRVGSAYLGGAINVSINTGTGTDQGAYGGYSGSWTGWATQVAINITPTTSFVKYTGTVTVPSGVNEVSVSISNGSYSGTGSANDYIDITGVQLEKGSTATSFDYRPYGTELQLCQRYYQKFISVNGAYCTFGTGHVDSATAGYGTIVLPVTTRAAATFGSSGSIAFYSGNSFYPITSFGTVYYTLNTQGVNFTCSGGGMTAGRGGQIIANNSTTAYVDFNAEL